MTEDAQSSKYEVLLEKLEGGLIMMHLDARHPELIVPVYLKDDPHLRLNLSYGFNLPDLDITEQRIQATLSFRGSPFRCVLPLDSLWGISAPPGEDLLLFPDSLPPEVLIQWMAEQMASALEGEDEGDEEQEDAPGPMLEAVPDRQEGAEPRPRPALRLVVDNTEEGEPQEPQPAPRSESPRPQLRVVRNDSSDDD